MLKILVRVPMEHSLLNNRNYYDLAVFKGRSFKIGWGKGFTIINNLDSTDRAAHHQLFNTVADAVSYSEARRLKVGNRYIQIAKINHITNNLNKAFDVSSC